MKQYIIIYYSIGNNKLLFIETIYYYLLKQYIKLGAEIIYLLFNMKQYIKLGAEIIYLLFNMKQ